MLAHLRKSKTRKKHKIGTILQLPTKADWVLRQSDAVQEAGQREEGANEIDFEILPNIFFQKIQFILESTEKIMTEI